MKWLTKTTTKVIILSVFPIAIGAVCSMLGDWDTTQEHYCDKVIALVILSLLYVALMIIFTKHDINMRQLETKNIALLKSIASIYALNNIASEALNKFSHSIMKRKRIDLDVWSFDAASIQICRAIYEILKEISIKGNKIDVTYVKLIEDGKHANHIKTVGCEAANRVIRNFNMPRDFTNPHGHYDCKVFNENLCDIKASVDKDEIFEMFNYRDRKNAKGKYVQYVNFPVVCENRKMIGLIQVVVRKGTEIAGSKEALEEIAEIYLRQFSNLAILFSKTEKALTSVPDISIERGI